MKRIFILILLLILIIGCTQVSVGKGKIIIGEKSNNSKNISSLIEKAEDKIPRLDSSLDTPEIVQKRIMDETESADFGDVV